MFNQSITKLGEMNINKYTKLNDIKVSNNIIFVYGKGHKKYSLQKCTELWKVSTENRLLFAIIVKKEASTQMIF